MILQVTDVVILEVKELHQEHIVELLIVQNHQLPWINLILQVLEKNSADFKSGYTTVSAGVGTGVKGGLPVMWTASKTWVRGK